MKLNTFGESQPGPDDDLSAAFTERYDNSNGLEAFRDEMSEEEHMGGWCVEVRNIEGEGLTVRDFTTRELLVEYLGRHHVELV